MTENSLDQVFTLIRDERTRQDKKWGADRDLPDYLWSVILTEELGETAKSMLDNEPNETFAELVQVAAVAVAWLEKIVRSREALH